LQQFHINIKYKIGSNKGIVDFLSYPPVATLTTVLNSCGHETSGWPQLYERDPNFIATYHMLGAKKTITDFHNHDEMLCHLGHLCIPSSERAKMIWESPYNQVA
jgi:hypothetical protein